MSVPVPSAGTLPGGRLQAQRVKHARAGKAMAAATFAMAGASGLQALLYLHAFGINARSDGFFTAFAVYASVGVFAQSLRVTSAPLLVGDRPALDPGQFLRALALLGVAVLLLTGPGALLLAPLLDGGLDAAARHITLVALPILGVATALQLWAAGAATLLALADRFNTIAAAYGLGAASGLAAYLALEPLTGRQTISCSMLVMAIVTVLAMLPGLRAARAAAPAPVDAPVTPRLIPTTAMLLGRTAIYLAFNSLYLITVAVAGRYGRGDATIISYAYLFASYLVAGTGFALGTARVADMSREARAGRRDLISATVPGGFRYAILLSALAVGLLVTVLAPLAGVVLPHSLSGHQVALLQRFTLLLCPWLVAAQLVNLLLPAIFALGRARLVHLAAPALVVVHLGATVLGGELFGGAGAVGAMCIAPGLFAGLMLATELRSRGAIVRSVGSDLGRFGGLALAGFGGAFGLMLLAPAGAWRPLGAGLLGIAGFVAGLWLWAGDEVAMVRSGLSRR